METYSFSGSKGTCPDIVEKQNKTTINLSPYDVCCWLNHREPIKSTERDY